MLFCREKNWHVLYFCAFEPNSRLKIKSLTIVGYLLFPNPIFHIKSILADATSHIEVIHKKRVKVIEAFFKRRTRSRVWPSEWSAGTKKYVVEVHDNKEAPNKSVYGTEAKSDIRNWLLTIHTSTSNYDIFSIKGTNLLAKNNFHILVRLIVSSNFWIP